MKYDVIIVGAGPAGLLAAWNLLGTGINFLIIERGHEPDKRHEDNPYDVGYGFGGAGLFSDGKISYPPAASKLWQHFDNDRIRMAYYSLRELFRKVGASLDEWDDKWFERIEGTETTVKEYKSIQLNEMQRRRLLDVLYEQLDRQIIFNTSVESIDCIDDNYVLSCDNGEKYIAYSIIMANGKEGCHKIFEPNVHVQWDYWAEMGVRIETENEEFIPSNSAQIDHKIIKKINEHTEVRTFCSCKKGRVRQSLCRGHVTFNGESVGGETAYSNIGIVVRTRDNSSVYAKEMEKCFERNGTLKCNIEDYLNGKWIVGENTDTEIKKCVS